MGREIKFRGLRADGKGWVYGSYVTDGKDYHAIIKESELDESQMLSIPIDPESLGQCTGLKDKNGTEIYEGDILCFDWRMQESGSLAADDCENIKGVVSFCAAKFIVRYFNNAMLFDLSEINQLTHERFWRSCGDFYKMTDFKVIGNIHENPGLLEGGE